MKSSSSSSSSKPVSLKLRAIGLLSQREHSVTELRRKLLRIESRTAGRLASGHSDHSGKADDGDPAEPETGPEAEVAALLVWLQAEGYLSEARFIESRVHVRARRFGSLRIKQELAQHGLSLDAESQAALKTTELARAQAVWLRKFAAALPADSAAWAKQARFLIGRGFASDVIRKVLRAEAE